MKIAFLSSVFGIPAGGAEVATDLLFEELRAEGHDVYILTTRKPLEDKKGLITSSWISWIPTQAIIPGNCIIDRVIALMLVNKLQEIKPDLIHIQDSFILPAVIIANKRLNLPCVVTCHASVLGNEKKPYSRIGFLIERFFSIRIKKYLQCLNQVDAIITVSEYLKNELLSNKIDDERITVIYNLPPKVQPIGLLSRNQNPIIIFTQGRLVKDKNFDIIVNSMKNVVAEEKGVKLVIAGVGPEMPMLKKIAQSIGVESYIEFIGWQNQADMMRLYAQSSMILIPAVQNESFGRGTIEAMTFGKPIIASDCGGVSEAVLDGINGFLVPASDSLSFAQAILCLVRDESMRERMGKSGLDLLNKRFNSRMLASQTINLYYKAIDLHFYGQ